MKGSSLPPPSEKALASGSKPWLGLDEPGCRAVPLAPLGCPSSRLVSPGEAFWEWKTPGMWTPAGLHTSYGSSPCVIPSSLDFMSLICKMDVTLALAVPAWQGDQLRRQLCKQ